MTDKAKKLEYAKQEIRSILLTQSKGVIVPSFLRDYKGMIGQPLPFKEFGYSTPEEFLRTIPDVVDMIWSSRYETYILKAVADETTKHIEKLVSKQKSSKSASIASRRLPPSTAPRFNRSGNRPLIRQYLPFSIKKEIFSLAKEYKTGLSLHSFLTAYRKKYSRELVYTSYGYLTLEDCLNTVPQVLLRFENSETRIYPIIENQTETNATTVHSDAGRPILGGNGKGNIGNKENQPVNNLPTNNGSNGTSEKQMQKRGMDVLDDITCEDEYSDSEITTSLREKFKEVIKRNPHGIWVTQFPNELKKLTGYNLDHRKLGYYNLVDLFNDLPEIFRIEVYEGCKDDWMLFNAIRPEEGLKPKEGPDVKPPVVRRVSCDIAEVIKNTRLLLQANSEGISFEDFPTVYEANCEEQFCLKELGFDSIALFLESIAEKVPLKIDNSGRKPRACYKKEDVPQATGTRLFSSSPLSADIPNDAVLGSNDYIQQKIPEDILNTDQFFPVYVSAVVNPGHMYIQLRRADASVALETLMNEMEFFYHNEESEYYKMPMHCIMSGAICAAIWPHDGRWHRIRISSVPSNDTVVAFFVDYGTKERIPSHNLKFLKKNFLELPAQAMRSHLCRLRPVNRGTWDPVAQSYILNSFKKPLMACLVQKQVGEESLPLILCDVSGQNDVFLNDLLVSKGLAEYAQDKIGSPNDEQCCNPDSPQFRAEGLTSPLNYQKSPFQEQPQMPVFPANMSGNVLQMMHQINSLFTGSCDAQNVNSLALSNLLAAGESGILHPLIIKQLQSLTMNNNSLSNKPATSPTQPVTKSLGPNFGASPVGSCTQDQPINSHSIAHESDSDIFKSDEEVDDDDNAEVNLISKRYVKRIILDDGYDHVHMIVIDDRPYMSSGDITFLLWNNSDPDFVRRKLKSKEISIPNNTVNEVGYEQLFYQLGRFKVKGIKTGTTGHSYVTLFPFKNVIDILNIFGHPSVAVRDIIDDELLHFDPSYSFWRTISEEEYEENPDGHESKNAKDKEGLYELKASLQAMKFRRQTLKNQLYSSATIPGLCDEIEQLETQIRDIERHIKDVQVKVVSHQRERGYD